MPVWDNKLQKFVENTKPHSANKTNKQKPSKGNRDPVALGNPAKDQGDINGEKIEELDQFKGVCA